MTSSVRLHAAPEKSVVPHLGRVVEDASRGSLADNVLQRQTKEKKKKKKKKKKTVSIQPKRGTRGTENVPVVLGALDEVVEVGHVAAEEEKRKACVSRELENQERRVAATSGRWCLTSGGACRSGTPWFPCSRTEPRRPAGREEGEGRATSVGITAVSREHAHTHKKRAPLTNTK